MPGDWLNVSHFKQECNYSGLAACVRMVLAHYGRSQTEAELRLLLDTQPSGTRARNIMSIASLGFEVELGSSSLSQLSTALVAGVPPIVFIDTAPLDYWQIDCAHVAVVVGIGDDLVVLHDPYFNDAPQKTSRTSFLNAWALNAHLAAFLRPRVTQKKIPPPASKKNRRKR
jgi:ABC-type bacteriocin/lantibiotic exporter with double-glycine peptidase domain